MYSVSVDKAESEFQKVCAGAHKYPGNNICSFNMAMAMVETHKHLKEKVGPNVVDWEWAKVHYNDYPSMPWSMTPSEAFLPQVSSSSWQS